MKGPSSSPRVDNSPTAVPANIYIGVTDSDDTDIVFQSYQSSLMSILTSLMTVQCTLHHVMHYGFTQGCR